MKMQPVNNHGQRTILFKSHLSAKNTIPSKIQACLPKNDLKGQSVAVIGLGKSGVAAVKLALARGASVVAVDQNENLDPLEKDPLFSKHNNVKTILGHFDERLLRDADRVVVSPGVPLETNGLSSLLQSGKGVMSELDFAAEVLPSCTKILAVTGTNGKSTVATFAGQMLNHLDFKTFVGGNLGVPLSEAALQCLTSTPQSPMFKASTVAVVEVSSYQLEIPPKHFFPSVAVILNLTPDHLERHNTMENYALTKCRILSHMSGRKMGVLPLGNQHLNDAMRSFANDLNLAWIGAFPGVRINLEAKVASFKIPCVERVSELQLGAMKTIGMHNYHNAAVAALSVIGLDTAIDAEAISSTIGKLEVPPHRMQIGCNSLSPEFCNDFRMLVEIYNCVISVTLAYHDLTHLSCGSQELFQIRQGSSGFERLMEPLKYHRGVVTIFLGSMGTIYELTWSHNSMKFGSSGMTIQKTLSANGLSIPCVRATNLNDAVKQARRMTSYGDAIVLSPGCASFDEFTSFEHRGRVFQELARLSE
ncbi:hypothetical protein RHMOL_Rhmol04G0136500 [Rhododendron molle]|uniref:Uncharacterized protein n=1 Tax=Rhododendron molle TaxID=49168 RepID=A0ACC0P2J7_RHOML|nr:hypothetical protein RHMOL_Rhmol04G0136500 [Rhododendron molle]